MPNLIDQYQQPLVRDIAWTIGSPAILPELADNPWFPDDAWYLNQLEQSKPWLDQLEQQPELLATVIDAEKDKRLGHRFETFVGFWLQQSEQYRVLSDHQQVSWDGQTYGEFDFIVRDEFSQETEHWELAVKFYLQVQHADGRELWHGPMLKDRLDIKLNHLQTKQCLLSESPAGKLFLQEQGWVIDRIRCLMKGRLFSKCQGGDLKPLTWLNQNDFLSLSDELQWHYLEKNAWFATLREAQAETAQKVIEERGQANRPFCVALIQNNQETSRHFVVPNDWEERALESLHG